MMVDIASVAETVPFEASITQTSSSIASPKAGEEVSFTVGVFWEGDVPISGTLHVYLDDPGRVSAPFWETEVTLDPGSNELTTPDWVSEPGDHVVTFLLESEEGLELVEGSLNIEVEEAGLDLLSILVGLLGLVGVIIVLLITQTDLIRSKGEEKGEEKGEKGFCEEHPKVVEEEGKACWGAKLDLESAVGDVQDRIDDARPRWQEHSRTVRRLIGEWDTMVAVIASWTGAEKELYETAEKVQKVTGIVTSAASKAKTAFKKGGEAALKEVGKDFAKDVASGIAGEMSETAGDLLGLEDRAMREIGIGLAKWFTGVDPRRSASRMRAKSEAICDALQSWVSFSTAYNSGRRPPDTLQSCIEEMETMLDSVDEAVKEFEDAVAGFRCVECEVPDSVLKEMDGLRRGLEDFMRGFGDLIDEVERRLNQALKLYRREDVYEGPYEHVSKSQRHARYLKRTLKESAEAKERLGIG